MNKIAIRSKTATRVGAGSVGFLGVFYRSTVGKKIIMAVTGAIGVGFVIVHLSLNLLAYAGASSMNDVDRLLKSTGGWLWLARAVLITAVVVHVIIAWQLLRTSRASRPVDYQHWEPVGSTFASRTMRWTGVMLLLFIPLHVLHLASGTLHPDFVADDVYHNVVSAFRVWYVSALYILAMGILGLHVFHGSWSMFQSVGFNHPRYRGWIRHLATLVTLVVVLGFISIPIAVLLGILS
ncbi:MAG: succinate dehydrogenase cytochrome b subunit [Chthoniobacterales bacterium]